MSKKQHASDGATATIAPGQIFTATVKDMIADGRGVAVHPSGRMMFVTGAWVGEQGEFRITQLKNRVGFADLFKLLSPSPDRVMPPCPYHGTGSLTCGGCTWQFVRYEAQLAFKQQRIIAALQRLGIKVEVQSIWPSTNVFGYRQRAQFKTDGKILGFVANQSNHIVSVAHCAILSDKNNQSLQALTSQLPNQHWLPPKNVNWTTVDIDEDHDVAKVSVNQRLPFLQANRAQNEKMRHWLCDRLAPLDKSATVIELFCGSGNFTEVIAHHQFREVIAIDGGAEAIEQLKNKSLTGVTARRQNLFVESVLQDVFEQASEAQILVLDPPRDGLKVTTGLFNKKSRLKEIFYISCDLATLCRDIKLFTDNRYRVAEVQPLDMLPHTPHIELLVHLTRK